MRPRLVVLAAGASRRLGTCKGTVDLGGASPLERLLRAGRALGSPADPPPLVVTGADHAAIAAHLAGEVAAGRVELVHNPAWERGRTGGVAAAARIRPGSDLCLAPVDVPLVPDDVFGRLAAAWDAAGAPARGWLAPFVEGPGGRRHGHPVVLGRALLESVSGAEPDLPLRELRGLADPLLEVEVAAAEILDDLDRPEDLATLRKRIDGR